MGAVLGEVESCPVCLESFLQPSRRRCRDGCLPTATVPSGQALLCSSLFTHHLLCYIHAGETKAEGTLAQSSESEGQDGNIVDKKHSRLGVSWRAWRVGKGKEAGLDSSALGRHRGISEGPDRTDV